MMTEPEDVLTLDPASGKASSTIQHIDVGAIKAGETATKLIYMRATRIIGERSVQLRVSVQSFV
jgi:hypothetical protein